MEEDNNPVNTQPDDNIQPELITPATENIKVDPEIATNPGTFSIPDASSQPAPNIDKPKPKNRKKLYLIILAVVILIAAGVAAWYFVIYKPSSTANNAKVPAVSAPKPTAPVVKETDPQVIKFITPTTGESWLDNPVKIAKQGFFVYKDPSYYAGEGFTDYFRVGTRGKNTIILTSAPGVVASDYHLYEQSPDGIITVINHPSSTATYNSDYSNELPSYSSSKVQLSNDIHYDSLSVPDQIRIDEKGSIVTQPAYPSLGNEYIAPTSTDKTSYKETLVKQLGGSSLYLSESTNLETKLVSISYFIKTPFNSQITMGYEPLDLSLTNYKWETGFSVGSSLNAITRGCGSASASVTRSDSISQSDVVEVGKSGKGLLVYGFKDKNNSLLQKAFTEFKDFLSYDPSSSLKDMTIDDFMKEHGVVLYKDVNGQWLVYVNSQLAPMGGCAKPVVYLYPQTEESVTVRVGADVEISDPFYNPSTGWTAVAKPNGQLTVNGVNYNSLFWEGPGYGQYPQITEGTVVKQGDVMPTVRKQLAQQGLNQTEINDFIEYWNGKLPTKPYVRLTWFNTAQMDKLAPLFVYPKPDTVIRVFLDASGLDKPISLPSQNLQSIPRKGFTLVEWGGLPSQRLY